MPSGYTHEVQTGKITTLRDFALCCARGMGATIMMRDEPRSTPIPRQFEPFDYHSKRLEEAEAELAVIDALQPLEADERASADFAASHAEWQQRRDENGQFRERYEAMRAKVEAWQGAPDGLKEFMLDQLRSSIDFDCNDDGWEKYDPEPVRKSGPEWRRDAAAKALKDIAYHREEYAKEVSRTNERNRWLSQLWLSLDAA